MAETWTVLKMLEWTTGYFGERGIEGGRLDAELLLGRALDLDRVGLYLNFDRPLTPSELASYRELVKRRGQREPVQYILGEAEFWSLPFAVSPAVLVPRPDTEVLVEEALKRLDGAARVLDVGTGSGAIAVAIAHECPEAAVVGLDLSAEALEMATANARRNGVEARVELRRGDLHRLEGGPYDLVVSNPPYIPRGDLQGLMPEVTRFEPQQALCGGEDGLDCYRALAAQATALLAEGGWLLLEVGIGQADEVRQLLREAGLGETFSRDDYGGIARVVGGRRPAC